jgi:hypothetical protein
LGKLRLKNLNELLKMIVRLIFFILAISFAYPSNGQGSGSRPLGSDRKFEFGSRPPLAVFDPSALLLPESVKEISDQLAEVYQKEGIDIIVVVLSDVGNAPPEHVARSFAREWCSTSIHCVVLHVPGREDSPWIVPDGDFIRNLNPEQVRLAVERSQLRASAQSKDVDKVKAAATEAADMLRFWLAHAVKLSEANKLEDAERDSANAEDLRIFKTRIVFIGVAIGILVIAGTIWILALRKNRPRYFGLPTIRRRLGAPYAGGNHAVVDLGPPPF